MKHHLDLFLELGKVRISSLATVTMITGYILARGGVGWNLIPLVLGVFLIACASATVNHIQERHIDARMARTKNRPLPSGRITMNYAVVTTVAALATGLGLIWLSSNLLAVLLGLTAVLWYNGIYTPLKQVTAFAAVPGGVVGAIPPVIGWVAGGGNIANPAIWAVAFFFFMWQVPHFWLLLLFTCGKDYERAGLPSLTRLFTFPQISRITFVWIFSTIVTGFAIPLFGIVANPWINLGLIGAGLWLLFRSVPILRNPGGVPAFRLAFKQINLYICWVIVLLSVNGIIS